jgi:hypothetical protein
MTLKSLFPLSSYFKLLYSFFPTLIPLSGVGATCFSSCCDKDSAINFTTGRLPDVNPPWEYYRRWNIRHLSEYGLGVCRRKIP